MRSQTWWNTMPVQNVCDPIMTWTFCPRPFRFDLYEQHMVLCNESCSAGRPVGLSCLAKTFNAGHYTQTFQAFLFIYLLCLQTPVTSAIVYQFHWPSPCLGVTRSAQSKTSWLHFLPHFSADQDEIWYSVETVQLEHPDFTFEWDLMKQRIWLVFYYVKNVNVGINIFWRSKTPVKSFVSLNLVYRSICFRVGMLIDTV